MICRTVDCSSSVTVVPFNHLTDLNWPITHNRRCSRCQQNTLNSLLTALLILAHISTYIYICYFGYFVYGYYRTVIWNPVLKVIPTYQLWPPKVSETATKLWPASLQKHSPGGCTVHMPRQTAISRDISLSNMTPCYRRRIGIPTE